MRHALVLHCPQGFAAAVLAGGLLLTAAPGAFAQAAPAAASASSSDTPSIKLGATIFSDYTYQSEPTTTDAAGNTINPSSFNVSRAYINLMGNVSRLVSFRITPDVTRETGSGSSLNGSLTLRLKYAYGQISLDDWLPKGSWIRIGQQQTPYLDYAEGIYRYRFQGTMFPERQGYLSSADAGVSFHATLPGDYGDVHVGYYNGENYNHAEVNNQKSFQARASIRPVPGEPLLKGWRVTGFVVQDHYMEHAPRNRYILQTTYEHPLVNVGVDYLKTTDKASSALTDGLDLNPTLEGTGVSFWATPKKAYANGSSIEALVRYDHMKPGGAVGGTTLTSPDAVNNEWIGGVAYWFPKKGSVSYAIMFDVDNATYSNWATARPTVRRFYVHTLVNF